MNLLPLPEPRWQMQEWIYESKRLYSESSLDFFLAGDTITSSLSAKSVRVRTLCIRWLPFLLCQDLLRKAEPVGDTYLGLFATMVWPFVIVRVVQQSMGRCSFWVEGRKLGSAGQAVEREDGHKGGKQRQTEFCEDGQRFMHETRTHTGLTPTSKSSRRWWK